MRYTPNRKHAILDDIARGRVTREAIMRIHYLFEEEMREWERYYRGGVKALRVTRRAK